MRGARFTRRGQERDAATPQGPDNRPRLRRQGAAPWRQPDVRRGGSPFPAQDGSSDCGGIRDCERAGHSGQEGETRGCSAWLSGWLGAPPAAALRALRARSGAACSARAPSACCGGRARWLPRDPGGRASPGGCPRLGLQRAMGPAVA